MTRTFTIDETAFPDLPQLMLVTVQALGAMGGSASIHELDEKVVEMEGVSEAEQAFIMPDNNTNKLKYYLSWARTYLKRGGALVNSSRGVWALTDAGEAITSRDQTVAIRDQVNAEERERRRAIRQAQKAAEAAEADLSSESQDQSEDHRPTDDPEDGPWKDRLLDVLRDMDPSAFERLSQRLLREAGFIKVEVRGKTGDGGIDGVGVLRVNLVSFQVYFQCKRWKGSVGSKEIRDFRGALQGRADKGLFITTGTFTSQASEEATRDGAIAIDLIDGDRLCDLLKQYELGVTTTMIEKVDIQADWFRGL
ncbi:MAG: restriction endonuclease [Rhodobacterales bacterium]|nr:restriction endonuclease [Rhodobacterales bacterium]